MCSGITQPTNPAGLLLGVAAPSDLSEETVKELTRLVATGGQVRRRDLMQRLLSSRWLAYAADGQTAVGVAALKIPHDGPTDNAFVMAHCPHKYELFAFEIGFLMVAPRYRGQHIASTLARMLCDAEPSANMYATVSDANHTARSILVKTGFSLTGLPFADRRGRGTLLLFVKIQG